MSAAENIAAVLMLTGFSVVLLTLVIIVLAAARIGWRDILGGIAFAGICWAWLSYGAAFLHLLEPPQHYARQLASHR